MPQKSKVKFPPTESQIPRKEVPTSSSPAGSDTGTQVAGGASKKKIKKLDSKSKPAEALTSEATTEEEFFSEEPLPLDVGVRPLLQYETPVLIIPDTATNEYGGSLSELEIPPVPKPLIEGATAAVCPPPRDPNPGKKVDDMNILLDTCNVGMRMTTSQRISPCMKSDDQNFSTTDYATSAAPSFVPTLIHPINGQVSTFIRHREFTDYLRSSGCLRLFGTCILNVYRMKTWPSSEKLMEHLLSAMGQEIPSRKQVVELNKVKLSLTLKLKELIKERCQILEKLDEYQGSPAGYDLLDQDEILPPRPENTPLNMNLMREVFRQDKFISGDNEEATSGEMPVIISKTVVAPDTLKIPIHDKRMLH